MESLLHTGRMTWAMINPTIKAAQSIFLGTGRKKKTITKEKVCVAQGGAIMIDMNERICGMQSQSVHLRKHD